VGIEKNRAMQNMEGVHQLLIPELGNKPWCACMEGVHIWRVLEWRVHCMLNILLILRIDWKIEFAC